MCVLQGDNITDYSVHGFAREFQDQQSMYRQQIHQIFNISAYMKGPRVENFGPH